MHGNETGDMMHVCMLCIVSSKTKLAPMANRARSLIVSPPDPSLVPSPGPLHAIYALARAYA